MKNNLINRQQIFFLMWWIPCVIYIFVVSSKQLVPRFVNTQYVYPTDDALIIPFFMALVLTFYILHQLRDVPNKV